MLSQTQGDILALVTGAVVDTTRGNCVSGKFLRRASKGVIPLDALAANLDRLVPTHLTRWGTPQKLDDEYALTFDGLLESSHAGRARAVLLAVLRTWIAKSSDDAEFRTFSWPEVKATIPEVRRPSDEAADGLERQFFDFVIRLAKLAPNATMDRQVWQWTTAQNAEALMTPAADTGEVDDFIAAIRAELNRPPPVLEPLAWFGERNLEGREPSAIPRGGKDRRLGALLGDLEKSYSMDAALAEILRRDANEIESAREAGLHKSVLVLGGSILEGALVDVLDKRRDLAEALFKRVRKGNANKRFPDDASLPDLLAVATSDQLASGLVPLLGRALGPVAQTVIDHRDLIHPHREVRQQQLPINEHTSEALYSLVCVVLHEVARAAGAGWVRDYEKA